MYFGYLPINVNYTSNHTVDHIGKYIKELGVIAALYAVANPCKTSFRLTEISEISLFKR